MAEGEALPADGARSHNHFWFRSDAIDVALEAGDAASARRHADALERYASVEQTPWSDFTVARGRALADVIDGHGDVAAVRALRARAVAPDLRAALPARDAALTGKYWKVGSDSLLSGQTPSRFNWLALAGSLGCRAGSISACCRGIFSKRVTERICSSV